MNLEENMKLNTEKITKESRFWQQINSLAKEAFPAEEYLAPDKLVEMSMADNFDFLALTNDDTFVGFMVVQTHKNLAYLFFLAIDSSFRAKGYGRCAIETLRLLYPDKKQVVDFEMLDEAAPNNKQRIKRRQFYLKNGYKETGLFLSYLGVDYEVFCMGSDFEPQEFKDMMAEVRVEGFEPKYFNK